jgi:hypothetical protein
VSDKLTSPAGEEFVLADASVNRVLVKGVVAVMHARTERLWSTKEGDMFLCADAEGNLDAEQATGAGFYWRDTRYLSDFRLEVDGHPPLLLSTSADRAYASHVDLANQDLVEEDGSVAAVQGTVNIRRTRVIDGRLYERIRVKNYNAGAVTLTVRLTFGTDFADIFEVRGLKRAQRGRLARPKADRRSAVFAYAGEDGVFRETRIGFELEPTEVSVEDDQVVASWRLRLEPTQTELIALTVERGRPAPGRPSAPSTPSCTTCAAPMRPGSGPAPASGPTTSCTTRCCRGGCATCGRCSPRPGTAAWWRPGSPGSWPPSAATRCSPATRP